MRRTLLSGVLMVCCTIGHTQFETGKKIVGGQFNILFNKTNFNGTPGAEQRSSYFSSSLSLSRFKSPTRLNGFGFNYGYSHSINNVGRPSEQTNYNHGIGFFINSIRLQPLARKFYLSFTGTAGAGYNFGKLNYISNTNYSQSNAYSVSISGEMGLWYQLNQRFLLTCNLANLLNLSYQYGNNTTYAGATIYKSNSNGINLSSGLSGFSLNSMAVGVRYILK